MCEIISFGFVCKMYAVGLWMSFSSCNRQLSFALVKPSYLNWHEISVVTSCKKVLSTSEDFTSSTHCY